MLSETPQAILFDLDDTIIAYDAHTNALWLSICQRFAPCLNDHTADDLFAAIRKVADWYWSDPERHRKGRLDGLTARREIVASAVSSLGIKDTALAFSIADTYYQQREDWTSLLPGAKETLAFMKERGIRLALVTNGAAEQQRRKIQKYGLEPFFDYILIEGEFGTGKPARRVFEYALQRLHTLPQQAWMVGDNLEWEVPVPQQLGMFAVWVDWRKQGLPEESPFAPNLIVNSIAQLPDHMPAGATQYG
ncbi:MAG: HAD family hydrolase [Chloroflexi bacterium]|nr:HAD family hydrolase [Chloroflexota bacterium]